MGAVNCDEHKQLCSQHGVRGYPTIKALRPGSNSWQDYNGARSAGALASWAKGLIPDKVSRLRKRADLDALLAKCGGSGKRGGSKEAASWGLCVVLASSKADPPPLLQALASAFSGRVAFGFAPPSAADVLAALPGQGNKADSRLFSICNGDLALAELYSGKLKSEPLQRHLRAYSGGKACASKVVLTPDTDLSKLRVAQLRALVKEHGVSCEGCLEKGDYVAALAHVLKQRREEL